MKPKNKLLMHRRKNNFSSVRIKTSKHLQEVMSKNITSDDLSYYLILNTWDKPSKYIWDRLPDQGGTTDLNVIDIFDIPNVLSQMRSIVAKTPRQMKVGEDSSSNAIPYSWLSGYSQLPMLVVLHSVTNKSGKQTLYPRMVTYNGSIVAELGI